MIAFWRIVYFGGIAWLYTGFLEDAGYDHYLPCEQDYCR